MKSQKMNLIVAVFILLPGFIINVAGQESVDLKYDLNQGDQYSYNMTTDMDITFDANGMSMTLGNIVVFESVATVQKALENEFTIGTRVKRIKSTQKMFGMEVRYDSDDPSTAQNPMVAQIAAAFSSVVGKSYIIVMDEKGNISHTDMSQLSENEDIAKSINSGTQYAIYPERKIKVGDSWEQDITPVEESDMKVHAKYTLKEISGNRATLAIEGTIMSNAISDVEIKMNGTQKGTMVVDLKTGWLIKTVIHQSIEMDIEQAGQKFPASAEGTTTVTSSRL